MANAESRNKFVYPLIITLCGFFLMYSCGREQAKSDQKGGTKKEETVPLELQAKMSQIQEKKTKALKEIKHHYQLKDIEQLKVILRFGAGDSMSHIEYVVRKPDHTGLDDDFIEDALFVSQKNRELVLPIKEGDALAWFIFVKKTNGEFKMHFNADFGEGMDNVDPNNFEAYAKTKFSFWKIKYAIQLDNRGNFI